MDGERTDQVFVTMWKGKAVVIPLLKYGNDVVPEGFFGNDVELVRRWMDFKLATQLRRERKPVVDLDLIMSGSVVPDRPAYHREL